MKDDTQLMKGILEGKGIWRVFVEYGNGNELSEEKLDILNRCEELGMDIVTYAENILEETNEHDVS